MNRSGDAMDPPYQGQQARDIEAQQQQSYHAQRAVASLRQQGEPHSPTRRTPPRQKSRIKRTDSPPTPSFPSKRRPAHPSSTTSSPRKQDAGPQSAREKQRTDHIPPSIHMFEQDAKAEAVPRRRRPISSIASASDQVREVDFYRTPTVLGRCIVNQKYGNALKRALQRPEEAKTWLCSKQSTGQTYSIRQLPIHIACSNLMCTYDHRQARLLNELITLLVLTYPEGAHQPDHRDRLPMFEALWYGADAQTLAIFFIANPEALTLKDKKGRSLGDLNTHRHGLNKAEVQKLIDRGVSFWQKAREEMLLRLKIGEVRVSVNGTDSVVSDAGLISNQPRDGSVVDEGTATYVSKEEDLQISWDQLEKRSIAAERILTEVNERNYELSQRVEAMASIEELLAKDLQQELQRLDDVNADLARKMRNIESLLENHVLKQNEEVAGQLRLALAEISSLAALSDKSSLSDHSGHPSALQKLGKQLHRLDTRQEEQREKVRKVKFVIDSLLEAGYDSSTEVHSELSSKSNYSTEFKNAPGLLVDRTPSTRLKANNLELEAIFKYGAAYDFGRRFPDLGEASPDDLGMILAWAASQETIMSFDDREITSSYSPERPMKTLMHTRPRVPHPREIRLPALLPSIDHSRDIVFSYSAEQQSEPQSVGTQSLEEVDPIPLDDDYTEIFSETQVSI